MYFTDNDKKPVKNLANNAPKIISTNPNAPALKILTLSGTESVTKNMTIYECGDDIIIVDCGVGFPDSEMLGVDVVIPDMTYVFENSSKVKGLFITHGHEDHFGAVPFLLKQLNLPIYTSKLVQGFLTERLKEKSNRDIAEGVKFHLFSPDTPEVSVGCFTVSAFRINHSVPSSMGFAIKTPHGVILHMADYKIDFTPVLDKPIDLATISKFGDEGVLCLLSDCLGVTSDGFSKSETSLNHTFHELFEGAEGRQIFVTTISSNISRMYQIITAAIKHNRKVVISGRSMGQSSTVARGLGYLPFDDNVFVKDIDSSSYAQKDLVYIIAGCYGQQGSGLDRLARGEHSDISMEDNSLVIFSADPNPPGVAEDVERLMDTLTLRGAEVIYSKIQENLHVSGHGTKGDLVEIATLVRPKYFIPIGGTATKARAYTNLMISLGFEKNQVFELQEGDSLVFDNSGAHKGVKIPVKQVLVEGKNVSGVAPVVMQDRETLSNDGVFVIIIPVSKETKSFTGSVDVVTRGFVYVKESKALIGQSRDVVNKAIDKHKDLLSDDWGGLKKKVENEVGRFLYKQTGKEPLIIAHLLEI